MSLNVASARLPYVSVGNRANTPQRFPILRHASGRISVGKIAGFLALVIIGVPVLVAAVYFVFLASPRFVSESHFAVRSSIAGPAMDIDIGEGNSGAGKASSAVSGLGGLGDLGGGMSGSSSSRLQDPFVVSSYLMSPEMTRRLDDKGWLRKRFSRSDVDRWSRLANDASQEELFAYWRRHVTAAVERRSNTIQLRVRAYSAQDARDIGLRALAISEEMLGELTMRQRDDTLALARAELVEAESRYEATGLKIRQMRRESRIVDPASEVKATGTTLIRLLRERIQARTEMATIKNLGGGRAPGLAEIQATILGLDAQIVEANSRLTGNAGDRTILNSVADLEALELERRFAEGMLNVATGVFDQARREAEHKASFLLVYLEPALPSDAREPAILVSIAFVAALAAIAWLFMLTAVSITLDQLD